MATIVLAANKNGNGHKANISIVKDLLVKAGHNVYNITAYSPEQKLVYNKKGQLSFLKSLMANIKYQRSEDFENEKREIIIQLSEEKIDLVISDFDIFVAQAAKALKIPVLGLSSQIAYYGFKHPWSFNRYLYTQMLNMFCCNCDSYIVPTWHTIAEAGPIGPLINPNLLNITPLPYRQCEDILIHITKGFEKFFPFDKTYNDQKSFERQLYCCDYIISTGGHNLLGEAIHLKKPVLIFPIPGHYEQLFNAREFERRGFGMIGDWSDPKKSVREFNLRLPYFRAELLNHTPTPPGNNFVVDRIQRVLDNISNK